MFVVPKKTAGLPRLLIALAIVLGMGGAGWTALAMWPKPTTPEQTRAVAEMRPPIVPVDRMPRLSAALAADRRFMGAILVAKGDQILFRQARGMAVVDRGRPNGVDTRFRLASVSKQFTAAAILKLQDEGRLSVDDPVCKWIRDCPTAWAPIRIRHLLSHTSGIPDLMARPGWGLRRVTPADLDALTTDSAKYGLQFEPGTKVAYDNAGFNLAAAIVERASGMRFEDYLRTALFEPIGMTRTGVGDADDLAMGYADFPSGLAAQTQANVSIVTGAGAVYSTLDDLLAWHRALHGGRVLKGRSYQAMIADHAPAETKPEHGRPHRFWGYGLFVNNLGRQVQPSFEDRQIYHTGSWAGFRNLVIYQPDQEVTVIILSNNYNRRDEVFLLAQQAMAEALGRPFPTALDR